VKAASPKQGDLWRSKRAGTPVRVLEAARGRVRYQRLSGDKGEAGVRRGNFLSQYEPDAGTEEHRIAVTKLKWALRDWPDSLEFRVKGDHLCIVTDEGQVLERIAPIDVED
jgi:hypothetical protein